MKLSTLLFTGLLAINITTLQAAEGIITLACKSSDSGYATNELQITERQSVRFKTFMGYGASLELFKDGGRIQITPDMFLISPYVSHNPDLTFAGPLMVRLRSYVTDPSSVTFVTMDIQPSAYPPDKAATVGPQSGNVRVTMEVSTDLVNWTAAENAKVYTNSADARFFRIVMDRNAAP